MKKLLIFGSTGSIGKNTLDVVRKNPKVFKVVGLCAGKDTSTILKQVVEFKPSYVCISDEKKAKDLKKKLPKGIKLFVGKKGLKEFASKSADISVMAISGVKSLEPLLETIKHVKSVALANKEAIVAAGDLVFKQARKFKTEIIPVDSEINAFFQLFQKNNGVFKKVYVTASGGAFVDYKKSQLSRVTPKQVLNHPTWRMGKRITVDSATLVNKGFEVVETHQFFDVPYKNIEVLIHRESAIHALVEYEDDTVFSCMYPPDMRIPISYALYYPARRKAATGFDYDRKFCLNFEPVDFKKYPLLKLVIDIARRKDNGLCILNAADEVAVDAFLEGKIKFTDIAKVLAKVMKKYPSKKIKKITDVTYWDAWARKKARGYIK
jgi:1-deoxy-D-xylulose-5-phosphate reductoisomerase